MPDEKTTNAPAAAQEVLKITLSKLHGLPGPKKAPDAPGKDGKAAEKQSAPAAEPKSAPSVTGDKAAKPDPATAKESAPATDKDGGKKPAPAADAKTPAAPEGDKKAADKQAATKAAPAADPKAAPPVADDKAAKPDPAAEKKEAPATDKGGEKKSAPAEPKQAAPASAEKASAPKPEEKKPDTKKPDAPVKPAEKKPDPAGEKPKQAAPADKGKVAAPPGSYAEGPTGTTITKVLGQKLNPPDEKGLAELPLPQEGEAFAVVLHPGYLKKAEFNHFSVDRDSDDFKELFKSIQMFGVKDPVLARPGKDGQLEILSGQRRHLIAEELNYPVPTIIQRMDDDDARILVADGNLHREKISIYDQSRALRMKMDSMKHKAGRRKKGEIAAGKSDEVLAGEMGISTAKLHRLMRLSDANRDICDMIDDGKLTLSVASAISQLKPAHQTMLAELININLKPSADQVERMRKAEASGKLTEKAMRDIIDNKDIAPKAKPAPVTPPPASAPTPAPSAPTPNPTPSMAPSPSSIPKSPDVPTPGAPAQNVVPFSSVTAHNSAEGSTPAKPAEDDPFVGKQERPEETKVVLRGDRLRKYFPDVSMTPREIEDKVYEALAFYQKHLEREKEKSAILGKSKKSPAR